ncbi:MAG TPA: M12 family metallo-peptidase, partial [Planctomycetota bacterium]|nr:M12 family metallo-peptidase [Planctomycetota bacterium]
GVARKGPLQAGLAPGAAAPGLVGGVLSAAALQHSLGLGTASLQALELPAAPAPGQSLHVRLLLDGADCDVVLLPHSLRAPDFRLLVEGADGVLASRAPAAPVTYRGTIVGLPESVVAASLVDGQLSAVIRLDPSRPVWGVQPATAVDAGAPRALHVVYDSADVSLPQAVCGTPDGRPAPAGSFAAADPGDKICEIACDTDVEFFAKNGSNVTSTMNDVETVINAVEAIYDADVGILYSITAIVVHTSEPDAYTATASNALLSQFTQSWNSTQSGVHRDIAHLLTGKELDGNIIGLAQLGVLCNLSSGYGLVQSKWTNNLALRAALSAHELGHNWNANHCDGESSCSIMCSGLGGCSGNVTSFNTSSKTVILAKKAASGCLDDAIPPPRPCSRASGRPPCRPSRAARSRSPAPAFSS